MRNQCWSASCRKQRRESKFRQLLQVAIQVKQVEVVMKRCRISESACLILNSIKLLRVSLELGEIECKRTNERVSELSQKYFNVKESPPEWECFSLSHDISWDSERVDLLACSRREPS